MPTRDGTYAVLGGSILLAFGFVGIASSTYLNDAIQLSTGSFLRLWAEAILALLFGFVVIIAGLLVGSTVKAKRWLGGVLGVWGSVFGGIDTLALLTYTYGLNSSVAYSYLIPGQLSASLEMLIAGAVIALFVGFPLGMAGSIGGLGEIGSEERQKRSRSPPTREPSPAA